MIKKINLCLIVIGMLFLIGCDEFSLPEEMIQKPNMDEKILVAEEVIDELPSQYEIIIPRNIENSAAINYADLSGDGKEELIVLCQVKDKINEFWIGILKEYHGIWQRLGFIEGKALDIQDVMFRDINNDGKEEIIIQWLEEDQTLRVEVYSEKNNKLFPRFEGKCDHMEIIDLDNDYIEDLVLFNITEEGQISASLYNIGNAESQLINKIIIPSNGNVREIVASSGKASETINGILIDVTTGILSGYTELLIKKDGMLEKVFSKDETDFGITESEYRSNHEDVDKDGIIEINLLYHDKSFDEKSNNDNADIQKWYNWDGVSGLKPKVDIHFDSFNRFRFYIPSEWQDNYIMEINESKYLKYMYIYDKERYPYSKNELARLMVVDDIYIEEFNKRASEAGRKYQVIGNSNGKTFMFYNNNNDPNIKKELKISDEKIKMNFEILR